MASATKPSSPSTRLPFTFHRKCIYILPTRHGLLFIAIVLGMLAGSMNYNNNLGFLLTFLLICMTLVSIVHTFRNLAGIQIMGAHAEPVFAGRSLTCEVHARSRFRIRPSVSFKFDNSPPAVMDLIPDKDNLVQLMIPVQKRGLHHPGTLIIDTHYPLGLFHAWSRLTPDITCLVYPKPIPGPQAFQSSPGVAAEGDSRVAGPGVDDFKELKRYQPGDVIQHIYWKSLARGQGLTTKTFTGQQSESVRIDWRALDEPDPETKISRLCGLVLAAHQMKIAYGLQLPETFIDASKGEAHRHRCLKALAMI